MEAGGKVHCLDRMSQPDKAFSQAKDRIRSEYGGGLEYHQVDVTQNERLEEVIEGIADTHQRLDGLIAGK